MNENAHLLSRTKFSVMEPIEQPVPEEELHLPYDIVTELLKRVESKETAAQVSEKRIPPPDSRESLSPTSV